MKRKWIGICFGTLAVLIASGVFMYINLFAATSPRFKHGVIDPDTAAQRAVADIDGDGRLDIFAAVDFESGKPVGLYWYAYPAWIRNTIAADVNFRADDMECGDVDGDGDPDMVVTVDEDGKIYWYENPRPTGDPGRSGWKSHYVGISGGYVKDVEVADLDGDGTLEIITRIHEKVSIFVQNGQDSWEPIIVPIHPKEGMDVGDLDGDGDLDIVLNGFWLETPPKLKGGIWAEHSIDSKWYTQSSGQWQDNCSNVVVADLNKDGKNDVILCQSEKTDWPISWYEATNAIDIPWREHVVTKKFSYCETLQAADMDSDGDLDLVAGEMKKSFRYGDLVIFLNNGAAAGWSIEKVANRIGIYDGLVADIGNDGDQDIIGCRDYNKAPIDWWENQTADHNNWRYHPIDRKRPKSQFGKMGLVFTDVNHDGRQDILAGSFVYLNPGGEISSDWKRIELPRNVDVYFAPDVDGDRLADLVGISQNEILWVEAANEEGSDWTFRVVGSLSEGPTQGHIPTQGYIPAQIIHGGKPELVFTRAKEMFYLEIPESGPETKPWKMVKISSENEEEGVAAGDIDGDADVDLAAISADGHHIIWLENSGAPNAGQWRVHLIGESSEWSDRIALVDINRDGRLDVITTEETQDWEYNSNVYWFEAPLEPKVQKWGRHLIATLRSVNSLDTADFDGDGDIDVVVAEHTDQRSEDGAPDNLTIVYRNFSNGKSWTPDVVERGGHSSHLGAKVCDLDNDGDLDIVSIAWQQYRFVHVWERIADKKGIGAR